jgi:hypothetical protein
MTQKPMADVLVEADIRGDNAIIRKFLVAITCPYLPLVLVCGGRRATSFPKRAPALRLVFELKMRVVITRYL